MENEVRKRLEQQALQELLVKREAALLNIELIDAQIRALDPPMKAANPPHED